jgi:hypothetical protein
MLVTSTATIALDGWPPPTIEMHALLAALTESGHDGSAGPATAFQHLNEVDVSFAFQLQDGARADSRAQQIVHEAMGRVYGGPIHVHVDVVESDPPRAPHVDLTGGRRQVVDLTAPDEAQDTDQSCSERRCRRAAALYTVSVATASSARGDLELTLPLCTLHAQSLGRRAVALA